jgi:hypothetical protein
MEGWVYISLTRKVGGKAHTAMCGLVTAVLALEGTRYVLASTRHVTCKSTAKNGRPEENGKFRIEYRKAG